MTKPARLILIPLAIGSLALAACGDDTKDSSTTTAAPSNSAAGGVEIKTFAFNIPATVPAGEVTITNADDTTHTFTHVPDDGSEPKFSVEIKGPNASKTITVEPGTYDVQCNIHNSMTGTLTVV